MYPQDSDHLPQRVRELVDSVKENLANLPADPEARAAAVVKINADLDELKSRIRTAPRRKVPLLVRAVLAELGRNALQGILDILLRWLSRLPGCRIDGRLVWS
jgi:uncharacterized protein (UPF0147 family)